MRQQTARLAPALAALGIVALAFLTRVYRLGDQNIWWDEGWTVWLAQHDWTWIALRTAADEHPPLHYWLMNLWQAVFGPEAFTGRFFSLLFGVLAVALLYRIGRAMGGARLGLLAALLLALARFNIWWSQDIKNYTLSAFFAWASVWFTWQVLFPEQPHARRHAGWLWVGYILCTALALFSHYLAGLVVLANNAFVVLVVLARLRQTRRATPDAQGAASPIAWLARWLAAQLAVIVLLAPWLYLYLRNGATWTAAPTFDFGLFLQLAATVLALGVTTFIENYTWIVLGLMLTAALSVGWLVVARRARDGRRTAEAASARRAWGTVYALLILLIPPALIYLLSLTPAAIFAPKIQARYLMMLTPALALLLGLGILFAARYSRFAAAALATLVVGAQLFTLTGYYGARVLRDDYFSLAQMINNFGQSGDTVVLNTDQEYPTFLYYLKQPLAWVGVPNGANVDAQTAQRIAAQLPAHGGVWVVTIPDALQKDPQHLVEQAIGERLPKQWEQTFGDKRLTLYADAIRNVKDVPRETFTPQLPRADVFDERLKLVGIDLPVHEAFAGDIVRVVTYWEALDLTTINLALQTPDGRDVAQASIPISIGARERAQGDLQVPPDLAAGTELRVVAKARLNTLPLGTVRVRARGGESAAVPSAPLTAPQIAHAERFGEHIRLVGVSLPAPRARAGENVPLTLYWQTDAPLDTSYKVFVHLLGSQYNPAQNNFLWGQVDRIPLDGQLPTNAWTPQLSIADAYQMPVNTDAPHGLYRVEIGLYDAATGARLRVFDAAGQDVGDALIAGEIEIEP